MLHTPIFAFLIDDKVEQDFATRAAILDLNISMQRLDRAPRGRNSPEEC